MKLVQKQFLRGSREFEITADAVQVRIKGLGRQETLTIMLAVLIPEPVENGAELEFQSRVNREALVSLLLDKPDRETVAAFATELTRRAREAYGAFTGLRTGAAAGGGLAANSYEEPPDFDTPAGKRRGGRPVKAESIESSIRMLEQHVGRDGIETLLDALASLQANPNDESRLDDLAAAFDRLGPRQGAVLTYAPYLSILLSDDPFGF